MFEIPICSKPNPTLRFIRAQWFTVSSEVILAERDGPRYLSVVLNPSPTGCTAVAIESDSVEAGMKAILESHSHEVIVEGTTKAQARRCAERYVQRWLRKLTPAASKCRCTPIAKG